MTWLAQYLVFHLTSDSKGNTWSSLTIIKSLFPIARFSQTYIKFMTFFIYIPARLFLSPGHQVLFFSFWMFFSFILISIVFYHY